MTKNKPQKQKEYPSISTEDISNTNTPAAFSLVLNRLLTLEYPILNPDVAAAGLDPIAHFEKYGRGEQRPISLLFDKEYLKSEFSSPSSEIANSHYADIFFAEENTDILPSKWLNIDYIRSRNAAFVDSHPVKILEAILTNDIEFVHPLFDQKFYLEQTEMMGIVISGSTLLHYLHHGWRLGIEPHPFFDSWYFQETSSPPANIAPWLFYVQSDKYWKLAVSPFVDEGYLNHQLVTLGFERPEFFSPLSYALHNEQIGADMLHPHLTRTLVDYLKNGCNSAPYELKKKSPASDLAEQVSGLRLKTAIKASISVNPKISVIIVNYKKPVLTLLSVLSALKSLANTSHEVILVDNDGSSFENELYYRYLGHFVNVKIIPTTKNLFFGEGNNIAIDKATGQYVWFLNNDAFADSRSAEKLIEVLDNNPKVGAIGPVMFDATVNIGEAGGLVSSFGEVVQLAKGRELDEILCAKLKKMGRKVVDYVSAASILVRTEILRSHGGFDYTYEPFYYEDTDLCLRIKQIGFDVEVHGDTYCLHLENTSTREFLTDKFNATVARSREKFFSRWVMAEENSIPNCKPVGTARISQRSVGIYTPFPITLGGGENYILSLAAAAAENSSVTIITDIQTSITRFAFVLRDLGIENFPFAIATKDECSNREFDIAIAMGNEIIPTWIPRARKFIYHCQFPFPINHSTRHMFGRNEEIDSYIVNSDFTKRAIVEQTARYQLKPKQIHVISPPVNLSRHKISTLVKEKLRKGQTTRFTSVGRFFASGHCKRQDVIARVLHRVAEKFDIAAEIYGGLSTTVADQDFYQTVKSYEIPQKITVNANVGRDIIETSMERAHYYIHAAGLGVNAAVNPHQCEHFGITVVEAMANGCIPIVYSVGGPAEIVKKAGVGYTFSSENELEQIVTMLALNGVASQSTIEKMAISYNSANEYRRERFHICAQNVIDSAITASKGVEDA